MRAFIDSDVLIWQLRGEPKAEAFLRSLSQAQGIDLWTGALQRAEIVFFMQPEEIPATLSLLSRFRTAPVTQEVVDEGGVFYRRWNPSHGTDVNDAILAATAMVSGGVVHTLNLSHYPMPEVSVLRAWD